MKGTDRIGKAAGAIFMLFFMLGVLFSCEVSDLGNPDLHSPRTPDASTGINGTSDHANYNGAQQPYTFTHDLSDEVPVVTMQPVDVQALQAEDREEQRREQPVPLRFGKALDVSLDLDNSGKWEELSDGARVWRVRIASQAAYSINLIFDQYRLPPGGELFIYNEDHSTVLGPFTEEHNKPYERFSTLPVSGALITLEYYEPAGEQDHSELQVGSVIHAYRNLFNHLDKSENAKKKRRGYYDERLWRLRVL